MAGHQHQETLRARQQRSHLLGVGDGPSGPATGWGSGSPRRCMRAAGLAYVAFHPPTPLPEAVPGRRVAWAVRPAGHRGRPAVPRQLGPATPRYRAAGPPPPVWWLAPRSMGLHCRVAACRMPVRRVTLP